MTPEERKESIDNLIDLSEPSGLFFVMLALSTGIIVPGLLTSNEAVIIGGMVVAPLLAPILSLALGVVLADFKLIYRAIRTIFLAGLLVVVFSFAIALFYDVQSINEAILSRTRVSMSYLLIAIASGAAAAFALARPRLSASLPGVAVAVALLPPLGVTGIGLAFFDWQMMTGAIELFLVNLIGMQFAALVVYSLINFAPAKSQVVEKLQEETIRKKVEEKIKKEEKDMEEKEETEIAEEVEKAVKKKVEKKENGE